MRYLVKVARALELILVVSDVSGLDRIQIMGHNLLIDGPFWRL